LKKLDRKLGGKREQFGYNEYDKRLLEFRFISAKPVQWPAQAEVKYGYK
jgi:hypothetical protein